MCEWLFLLLWHLPTPWLWPAPQLRDQTLFRPPLPHRRAGLKSLQIFQLARQAHEPFPWRWCSCYGFDDFDPRIHIAPPQLRWLHCWPRPDCHGSGFCGSTHCVFHAFGLNCPLAAHSHRPVEAFPKVHGQCGPKLQLEVFGRPVPIGQLRQRHAQLRESKPLS